MPWPPTLSGEGQECTPTYEEAWRREMSEKHWRPIPAEPCTQSEQRPDALARGSQRGAEALDWQGSGERSQLESGSLLRLRMSTPDERQQGQEIAEEQAGSLVIGHVEAGGEGRLEESETQEEARACGASLDAQAPLVLRLDTPQEQQEALAAVPALPCRLAVR